MKKLLALILSLSLMTVCATGCGDKKESDKEDTKSSSVSEKEDDEEETTEEDEEETTEEELVTLVEKLNQDDAVNGILVQLPLPKHINEEKIIQKREQLMTLS